jgi:hypothetical protein
MSEKTPIDTSNTDPKYWEQILANEGLPEEQPSDEFNQNKGDDDIETYSFSKTNHKGCQDCNPAIMAHQGCCSGSVAREIGRNTRLIKDSKTGIIYDICDTLNVNEDGNWECQDYSGRDLICRAFECDSSIKQILKK